MTIGDLKKTLQSLDDDMPVMLETACPPSECHLVPALDFYQDPMGTSLIISEYPAPDSLVHLSIVHIDQDDP